MFAELCFRRITSRCQNSLPVKEMTNRGVFTGRPIMRATQELRSESHQSLDRFMSLKRNVIANYVSQSYVTVLGIAMLPVYVRYLGTEAYGLVGLFGIIQSCLQYLDIGLSATLSREIASYRGEGLSLTPLNALIRALAAFFIVVGLLVVAGVWLSSDWIATEWLRANTLSPSLVSRCIRLMAAAAVLRWFSEPYRAVIGGWEKQVWLGSYTVAIATGRFILVLPLLVAFRNDPTLFFTFHIFIAAAELLGLWWKAGTLLRGVRLLPSLRIEPLRAMWRFSGALAFCSIAWLAITQTDKLILSRVLPLIDYAYFAIAITVANGVTLLAAPISNALIPRLTYLIAQRDNEGTQKMYRDATQWLSVIIWPAACGAAFFAEPLLRVWTQNTTISRQAAPVLFWYALGNALLAVASFQFYLQFAHGRLRLHVIGNAVFMVVLIPSVLWAAQAYGAVGAGRVWFTENLVFLLVWTWIVHRRFAPGLHWKWFADDVLPIALTAFSVCYLLSTVATWPSGRFVAGSQLILFGGLALISTMFASSSMRRNASRILRNAVP
jgi:O-antigen/teichoic acid export membrane protein